MLASKIISIAGIFVPAGVLAYSITFIVTDIIGEIWGKTRANYIVSDGFIALLAALILIQLSLVWTKAPFWNQEDPYQAIMGTTSRIIVASFVAYPSVSSMMYGRFISGKS